MKKAFLLAVTLLVLCMLTGCRYWGIDYVPQPQDIKTKEQAKAVLYKAFEQQPKEYGAKELVIDDTKITFVEKYSHKTIYYTTPDRYEMRKHLRTGLHCIFIYKGGLTIYIVRCFTEPEAQQFMNAFKFMQDLNTKPAIQEVKK